MLQSNQKFAIFFLLCFSFTTSKSINFCFNLLWLQHECYKLQILFHRLTNQTNKKKIQSKKREIKHFASGDRFD